MKCKHLSSSRRPSTRVTFGPWSNCVTFAAHNLPPLRLIRATQLPVIAFTMAPRHAEQPESPGKLSSRPPVRKAANKKKAVQSEASGASTEQSAPPAPAPRKRRRNYHRPSLDIFQLPVEIMLGIISYCHPSDISPFARTCKHSLPTSTEALFKTLAISLSNTEPCKAESHFKHILDNLHFTRHLNLRVWETNGGEHRFRTLLGRLNAVPLLSLRIRGQLDRESYKALDKFLNDLVDGHVLRAQSRPWSY